MANKKSLFYLAGILFVIILWEVIFFATSNSFIPEFFQTLAKMFTLLKEQSFWFSFGYTFLRLLVSFSVSALFATVLGLLAGYFEKLAFFLSPLMAILKSFPTVALVLLLVAYVKNFSLYSTSLVLFPLIYQSVEEGARKCYKKYEDDLRLKGRKHLSNITSIILPLSVNYILLGLIQAWGLGLKVEIMSETFAYSSSFYGLGKLLISYYQQVDYLSLLALVLFILFFTILSDLSLNFLKRKIELKIGLEIVN